MAQWFASEDGERVAWCLASKYFLIFLFILLFELLVSCLVLRAVR
jgi:hypothetical protein